MHISIKPDITAARKKLRRVSKKKIPKIIRNTLSDTARDGAAYCKDRARRRFNKPTRATISGFLYEKAKTNLLVSRVFIRDGKSGGAPTARWLRPQIVGGSRELKQAEKALRAKGVLPDGKYLTPGPGWVNAAGNLKPGVITRVISQLSAFDERGYRANVTEASKKRAKYIKNSKFFVIPGSGIFTRRGKAMQPVLFFASRPTYRIRFPFKKIVSARVRRMYPKFLHKEINYHLRSEK